jgi:hypothetical protein
LCVLLAGGGCAAREGTAAALPPAPAPAHAGAFPGDVPANYRCLPGLPALRTSIVPSLAYTQNCAVSRAREASRLQELAVALMSQANGEFIEYCTGTPLAYDAARNVGFVSTAAHCVIGSSKPAGASITFRNIATFDGAARIYQGTPGRAAGANALTAQIEAVYVPAQYCRAVVINRSCSDPTKQNGDVAILKVRGINGLQLRVNPELRLAPSSLQLTHDAEIMALGYGTNTTPTPSDRVLNYVTYRYFATNAYEGAAGELTIMNGYRQNGLYYAILCQGDSGGGDFAWDGTNWDLIGVHSYGHVPCGKSSSTYKTAVGASADARPWEAWMREILANDTSPTGCATLNPRDQYVCRSR